MPLIDTDDTSLDLSGHRAKVTVYLHDTGFRLRPLVALCRCFCTGRAFVFTSAKFIIDILFNRKYICGQDFMLNKKSQKVMGRPKVGIENAKGKLIAARFTQAESNQINATAKRLGLTKSQFLRKVLLSAV